jgi:hypothetical protein
LTADEEVLGFWKCSRSEDWKWNTGLVLTSNRVHWVRTSWYTGLISEQVALSDVKNIEIERANPHLNHLKIDYPGGCQRFGFFNEDWPEVKKLFLAPARK